MPISFSISKDQQDALMEIYPSKGKAISHAPEISQGVLALGNANQKPFEQIAKILQDIKQAEKGLDPERVNFENVSLALGLLSNRISGVMEYYKINVGAEEKPIKAKE
jgi:hypothetical protein